MAKYDRSFLKIAEVLSENSYAERKKVGAIVVKDGNIISMGWNGTPSGFDNDCEYDDYQNGLPILVTKPEVLHAELNALMKLAKSTNSSDGATMYITCSPCYDCSKLLIQSGIIRIVY